MPADDLPQAVAAADNLANPTAPSVLAHMMVWDGSAWDRMAGSSSGSTVDTELPAAAALADNAANPTAPLVGCCLLGYDGSTWDRLYAVADGDAVAAGTKGFVILGHDGSNYQILKTAADGALAADIESIAAGENHIGQVGSPGDTIDVTLTLDTSAYGAGDVLADTQAVTNAVRVNGGRAILQSLVVIDEDDQGAAMDVYLLDANNSLGTENAAPSVSDANARAILGVVSIAAADYKDLGGVKVANIKAIGLALESTGATRDLYLAVVTQGTPTHTASGVLLRLGLLWD